MQHSHTFFPIKALDELPHCPKCRGFPTRDQQGGHKQLDHDRSYDANLAGMEFSEGTAGSDTAIG